MRDTAHLIDQGEGQVLEKVQLERGGATAISEVENGEVFVVIVLEQV